MHVSSFMKQLCIVCTFVFLSQSVPRKGYKSRPKIMTTNLRNRASVAYVIGPSVIMSSTNSVQQKVSLYTKWFHWIVSEFTSLANMD